MPNNRERLLIFFFAALFFFNVGYIVLGFASIPRYYERVTTLTVETYSIGETVLVSNELAEEAAAKRGMTLSQYAIEQTLVASVIVVLCGVISVLVISRARENWFAWYSAFLMVFIAEYAFEAQTVVAQLVPYWAVEVASLGWALVLPYLYFFPNGKGVPRIALWLIVPLVLLHLFAQASGLVASIAPNSPYVESLDSILGILETFITLEIVVAFVSQIYRYLRVSNRAEKQQTKWFLFGLIAFIGSGTLEDVINSLPFAEEINLLIFLFVPVSVGIAILWYRLWDIDVLIRRTLTYAVVTALLAVVFLGSVVLLQQIFSALTVSGGNEIVTVISTLAIAALFVPVRNRVQSEIDKRFNRKKYDAQQVLTDFATTVRDETDLEKLTARLMQVVDETMQPKSVSVWLRQTKD